MAPAIHMELYHNPNHVVMPAPQLNHVAIPVVDAKTDDLTGYKVMVIKDAADLTNPFEVATPSPVVGEYQIPQYDHMDQLIGYVMKKEVLSMTPGVKTNPYDVSKPAPVHNFYVTPEYNLINQLTGYTVKPSLMDLHFKNPNHVTKPSPVVGEKDIAQVNHKGDLTGYAVKPDGPVMHKHPKKTNPFDVVKPAPVHGEVAIAQYNHKNQLTGYLVKPKAMAKPDPKLMELAAKVCKNKNHIAKPGKVAGMKDVKECFDKVLTGWTVEPKKKAAKKQLQLQMMI